MTGINPGLRKRIQAVDHGLLQGLADDDHAQYLLLAGRASQNIVGNLTLSHHQASGTWLVWDGNVSSDVGGAGPASALPATPWGYIQFKWGGVIYNIPFYSATGTHTKIPLSESFSAIEAINKAIRAKVIAGDIAESVELKPIAPRKFMTVPIGAAVSLTKLVFKPLEDATTVIDEIGFIWDAKKIAEEGLTVEEAIQKSMGHVYLEDATTISAELAPFSIVKIVEEAIATTVELSSTWTAQITLEEALTAVEEMLSLRGIVFTEEFTVGDESSQTTVTVRELVEQLGIADDLQLTVAFILALEDAMEASDTCIRTHTMYSLLKELIKTFKYEG